MTGSIDKWPAQLPELIEASVWSIPLSVPLDVSIDRFDADTMPFVTVGPPSSASALPIAMASSPTSTAADLPSRDRYKAGIGFEVKDREIGSRIIGDHRRRPRAFAIWQRDGDIRTGLDDMRVRNDVTFVVENDPGAGSSAVHDERTASSGHSGRDRHDPGFDLAKIDAMLTGGCDRLDGVETVDGTVGPARVPGEESASVRRPATNPPRAPNPHANTATPIAAAIGRDSARLRTELRGTARDTRAYGPAIAKNASRSSPSHPVSASTSTLRVCMRCLTVGRADGPEMSGLVARIVDACWSPRVSADESLTYANSHEWT